MFPWLARPIMRYTPSCRSQRRTTEISRPCAFLQCSLNQQSLTITSKLGSVGHSFCEGRTVRLTIVKAFQRAWQSRTVNSNRLTDPSFTCTPASHTTERRGAAVAAPDKRLWRKRSATAVTPSHRTWHRSFSSGPPSGGVTGATMS
jgi:hypothetical protein